MNTPDLDGLVQSAAAMVGGATPYLMLLSVLMAGIFYACGQARFAVGMVVTPLRLHFYVEAAQAVLSDSSMADARDRSWQKIAGWALEIGLVYLRHRKGRFLRGLGEPEDVLKAQRTIPDRGQAFREAPIVSTRPAVAGATPSCAGPVRLERNRRKIVPD